MVEYKPKYNPADNAEIKSIAEKMHKSELEDYYVKDKNNRHSNCGDIIGMIFATLVVIFILGALGYAVAMGTMQDNIRDNMQDISQEVCPYLSNGYASQEALHSSYAETRIVCDQTNSGWRGR